jgi:hypothetical protein
VSTKTILPLKRLDRPHHKRIDRCALARRERFRQNVYGLIAKGVVVRKSRNQSWLLGSGKVCTEGNLAMKLLRKPKEAFQRTIVFSDVISQVHQFQRSLPPFAMMTTAPCGFVSIGYDAFCPTLFPTTISAECPPTTSRL